MAALTFHSSLAQDEHPPLDRPQRTLALTGEARRSGKRGEVQTVNSGILIGFLLCFSRGFFSRSPPVASKSPKLVAEKIDHDRNPDSGNLRRLGRYAEPGCKTPERSEVDEQGCRVDQQKFQEFPTFALPPRLERPHLVPRKAVYNPAAIAQSGG